MSELTIGIDISKHHLDAACFTSGRQERFANDAAGLAALGRWIGPAGRVARLVYEATGRYHAGLEDAFAGWPLVKVNPLRARRFAEASGTHAKTDAVDARMLGPDAGPDGCPAGAAARPAARPRSRRVRANCGRCRLRAPVSSETGSP